MIVIKDAIEPGKYFLRMYTKAPKGMYYAVLMTWGDSGVEHKEYFYIDGNEEWVTHEFPFDVQSANRFSFNFEGDVIEVAYPLLVNRAGSWRIVTPAQNQTA